MEGEKVSEIVRHDPTPMELMQNAIERGMDPSQLTVLADLHERLERRKAERDFGDALANFSAECPQIRKERAYSMGNGPPIHWASYDDIMAVIQPLLQKHGISIGFNMRTLGEGMIEVGCRVRVGIHTEEYVTPVAIPKDMRVNDSQKMGAAHSYAKRYGLQNALNIVVTDEDRDAVGVDVDTITEEQAIKLQEMLEAVGEGDARFLRWAGVERVADLPAAKHSEAVAVLKKKLADKGR